MNMWGTEPKTMLILSVPRDGQLYLLQAIFRPWVMVVVRITVLGLELVLINKVTVRMADGN